MRKLSRSMPDLIKWVDPDEWFGIIQPVGGDLYEVLYPNQAEAEEANLEICGTIVVVQTRVGADGDEEYVSPKPRCLHAWSYDHSRGGMLCDTCGEFRSDQL